MSRQIRNSTSRTGFTIIELLIVIVIIAILATITVVAFNGVQARAQVSAMLSETHSDINKFELFRADNNVYPTSIADCPTPIATNICLSPGSNESYNYQANIVGGSGYQINTIPSYELTILGNTQFLYTSSAEKTASSEFMQYMDLGPIIDRYGLVRYQLSFDIKSANTATKSTMQVYLQNGTTARYSFYSSVNVTTSYSHQVVTFVPAPANNTVSAAMLAFYGTYSSGNIPTVKNVQIQLAP